MKTLYSLITIFVVVLCGTASPSGQGNAVSEGKRLFETETFGGNGRTCLTCHGKTTGTLSQEDVQKLFETHPDDPVFLADGSDDGNGTGVSRILEHATILVNIPLPGNFQIPGGARSVTLARGIPTTLNTPGFEALVAPIPVLMLDGRQLSLENQALGAIQDHAHATASLDQLHRIAEFELTNAFFSSPEVRQFVFGGPAPGLPKGNTAAETRGRRFFEDRLDDNDEKVGQCAACHAGPLLNQSGDVGAEFGLPVGTRFQNILVSEVNAIGNPTKQYTITGPLGTETIESPDPGRSLITGVTRAEDQDLPTSTFSNWGAFKIPQLRGIRDTGPYFHDNSAKTLKDVLEHYRLNFFAPGFLTEEDVEDIIAFMKLLR